MKHIGKYNIYISKWTDIIAILPTITIEKHKLGPREPTEKSINLRFLKRRIVISWFTNK